MRAQQSEIMVAGEMMANKGGFGFFTTYNPGYAGRTEIPDALKSQMRPLAMTVPNFRIIAK